MSSQTADPVIEIVNRNKQDVRLLFLIAERQD